MYEIFLINAMAKNETDALFLKNDKLSVKLKIPLTYEGPSLCSNSSVFRIHTRLSVVNLQILTVVPKLAKFINCRRMIITFQIKLN